jgi:ribose transport system permease protein
MGRLFSQYGLLVIGLAFAITFSLLLPATFPTTTTVRSILDAQAVIALLALAETIIVIVGEFDLSVGYSVGICSILSIGFITRNGLPWIVSVLLVICVGVGVGLVNGLLVHVAKIDSFIATLGVGTIAYAVSNWYTADRQVTGQLPAGFDDIYSAKFLGIPASGVYVFLLLVIMWIVLDFTPAGRYLYALGGNRRAAELSGIPARRYIIGAFMASGMIVAFAGVLLASRLQIGDVSNGPDFLLPIFVGAMLGSTTIKPGRANPAGTLVAVFVLGIGIAGFQQLGGSTQFIVPLFNGVTLVAGVGLAGFAARRISRVRRPPTHREEVAAPIAEPADSK